MQLSGREKVVAIAAAAVAGVLAFDYLVLTPMWASMAEADDRLQKAQLAMVDADEAQTRLSTERKRWSQLAGTSLSSDGSQAAGQLLNAIANHAQAAGLATPDSIRPERESKEQDFQRITMRASLTGSMSQLSKFLFNLKNADIPLRVNDVTITPRREGTDDLSMNILVSTIYIPPASAAANATGGRP